MIFLEILFIYIQVVKKMYPGTIYSKVVCHEWFNSKSYHII